MTNVKVAIIFMRVIKLSTKMNGKVLALKYKYQDKVDKVEESGETIKSIASAEEVWRYYLMVWYIVMIVDI